MKNHIDDEPHPDDLSPWTWADYAKVTLGASLLALLALMFA